ncbi:hypothetical protein GGS21DRAFT_265844 [Xylaria nigripes]|nr:hypothetical protein GGS21DRAFT_265844 [Xylaria nigripes]
MAPTIADSAPLPSFTPALEPPPGITSHPDHPASLAFQADIAIGISLPLVTIFYLLRSYVRIFIKRSWIIEDVLVTAAWAGTVAYCGILRATMTHHGGEHGWDITLANFHEASYWFNVAAIEYGVIIGVTKIAILCLYRRVFSPERWSRFDITIVSLIILLALFYTSISLAKIFECSPREKIWDPTIPGTCIQIQYILNVSGGFNTATDYLILLLPVHAVRSLQMPKLKRVFVVLAFTFGLSGPIFATVGFVVRLQRSGNADTSWDQPTILLWGAAELTSGNLCVCFPELAVLFHKSKRQRQKPLRPGTSKIRDWNASRDRANKNSGSHRYLPKSFMSTMLSTAASESYLELQSGYRHNVQMDHRDSSSPTEAPTAM